MSVNHYFPDLATEPLCIVTFSSEQEGGVHTKSGRGASVQIVLAEEHNAVMAGPFVRNDRELIQDKSHQSDWPHQFAMTPFRFCGRIWTFALLTGK